MKVIFSNQSEDDPNAIYIKDINIVDILVDDFEAQEIIVDNFLSNYSYLHVGQVLNKILSKLAINGKIILNFIDFDLVILKLYNESIDYDTLNSLVINNGIKSAINSDIVLDLFKADNIKITKQQYISDNLSVVIEGVRYV